MNRKLILVGLIIAVLVIMVKIPAQAFPEKDQPVDVIVVKGAIFSSTARYIERGIKQAEEDGAICIIQMDTPGGLIKSMREIIQAITSAQVPVVVYIHPQGAMATSAGTYITYAAHVAAMSPGTHIGSAHPVAIGMENKRRKSPDEDEPFGFKIGKEKDKETGKVEEEDKDGDVKKDHKAPSKGQEVDVGMEKATNMMVALIRSLAEKNGRNADWGEKAVRESVSITASEAAKMNVVEIMAEDIPDLLEKLKGRKVKLPGKVTVTLYPSQDKIKYIRMTGIEKFLLTINDPQIAIILMFLGTMGLYYELANPGAAIPGIVGGICIILGLYTLGSLPINYTALALIILSVILFIAEIFTPTFGALTMGGVIAFVLGALLLIPSGMPYLRISRSLIISLAIIMATISFVIFNLVLKSLKAKPFSGQEGLVGAVGVAKSDLAPSGMIRVQGELWKAKTSGDIIKAGEQVIVEKAEGLKLTVRQHDEQ